MGVRKRKDPEGEASPAGAAKRARKEEFTGVRFKAQLRDPQGAGTALEAFVSAAKKLPREDVYDVVEGYIKISVECTEIFQLLSGEKRPESEMLLVFQALEAILLRTASDLAHLHMAGTGIVKKLLNSHMKLLCEALYASGYRMARACLNLLTAMVAQGAEAARDVSSLFDLNKKTLYGLVTKRDTKGAPDVRQAYIQFALSFLVTGDTSTVVQVLELKEFIPCIFSSGIKEDRISTVNILLSTLKTKVVQNKSITKTQKVRFFSGQLLNHIASLYSWNGVVDVQLEGGKAAAAAEGKRMVRELVHTFLLDLCCSLKHGINFYDATLGTSGRGGNLTLLHLLLGLKTAPADELVAELVVSILRVCPDLLNKYFKEVTFSFLPRAQAAWTNNIRLLSKIYEAQPDISRAFQTREFIPLPRLLAMVMVTTAPLVCNKTMFTQALNLDSRAVKHTALSLLLGILRRALKTVEFCQSSEGWPASGLYSASMMDDFVRLFREALSKIFPDLNTIVWVWQSLVKHEAKQDDQREKQKGEQGAGPGVAPQHDDAETILLKAALLQVICLYQKVVPHLVIQYNFDFSKLLRGIISEQGVRAEVPPVLQHHILQVALELPASKFLWLKGQEGPEAEIIGGDRSVFYLLMKMFITSAHAQLKASTKLLIIKILRDTGVFEHTWKELELWLEHLDATAAERREAVIQFLERVLLTVVASPFVYTDKVSDFVQEASTLQASLSRQGADDDVSLPISHIDDVLDMVDVLVEGSEGLDEEIGFALTEDMAQVTFPFSAVVPAALQARNKLIIGADKEAGESVVTYLTAVLTDLLHSQRDPLALCLLLQAYDQLDAPLPPCCCPQLPRFCRYYSLWVPEANRAPALTPTPETSGPEDPSATSFPALLQAAYERKGALLDTEVQAQLRAALPGLPLHRGPLAARHLLLYVRSTVDNFGQLGKTVGPPQLQLLLDLLRDLVVHCTQLDAQRQEECVTAQADADTDLFLDMEAMASLERAGDKTLEEMLSAVLRHPTLEGWYLALEQQALPPHALGPVLVKLLAARLSAGVLPLLLASAPVLQRTGQLGLLDAYSAAIVRSVRAELQRGRAPPETLPQLEALRALHPFLGDGPMHELTLALLDLPEAQLLAPADPARPGPRRPLNALGRCLVLLLARGPRSPLPWAAQHARGLGTLLPSLAAAELDAALLHALQDRPELVPAAGPGLLAACLARPSPATLGLAELLLRRSATHQLSFERWCGREDVGPILREQLDDFLPLVHAYLQSSASDPSTRPRAAPAAAISVLRKALWRRLQAGLLGPDADPEAPPLHWEVLAQLVPFARAKNLAGLMDRLPDMLQTPGSLRSWDLADSISAALAESAEELQAWKTTQLAACVRWLAASFGTGPLEQDSDSTRDRETAMLRRFTKLLDARPEVEPGDWQALVKTGLKFRYQEGAFLRALHTALPLLYPLGGPARDPPLLPLPRLHAMVTQHSLFLPTLLEDADGDVKEALVDLMRALVRLCPSVCESSHFAVLLGAYGASLSALDQKILLLLRAYEQNHLSLISFRVLLWGPAAVDHHKTCRSLGKSLWQEPSVGDVLRLLDPDRMMATILHFPQNRRLLSPEDTQDPVFRDKSMPELDGLYDPCFLLHLFSELTRPEFVVDCRKFLDSNALGLTVAALSSYDTQMRAAAYSVLAAYYSHVEGARFREKAQVLYLLDVVRSGIRKPNMRLTFTLVLFIAKAARQVLKPEEHMYMKLAKFLLSHQFLHMGKIPGFFQFFYSSDFEQKVEREWMLELLRQGLRDRHCYDLYARRGVLRILLAFFNSPLCDPAAQIWILEILQNAAQTPKPAYEVLRDYSLLTWILHILESPFLETPLLAGLISLLQALWETNLGNKGGAVKDPQQPPKHLPLQLVSEFLFVLTALTRHLRPALTAAQLTAFLGTLESVLRYRATVLQAFRELGRFTVAEAALTTGDVMLLLQRWALLGRDTGLQEALRAATERLPPGRLLKMLRDMNKPSGPARARGPRGRRRRPGNEEAVAAPELPVTGVGACQGLLRAILTHWTPAFPGPEPMDGATPECITAALAASWALRSMAGCPPDAAEAARLLGWLETHILPQPAVVAQLLEDGAADTGLFGLYTQLSGAEAWAGPSGSVARQFNAIMLRLLATRGLAGNPVHTAVEGLCQSSLDDGEEAVTRATAAFLVSLYIKDMWLGAPRPDTLLAHVRMVCDAAITTGEEEEGDEEEPVVKLCRALQASIPDP
ncbi:nucleolar pre-ribosomal-associated protein 1 [Sorex fumeus]|uniref:nucleolar pre-ribosomal-associated protein 1 n=1 Tax=Sorex fumeus TaxID=62283 RepID=UPI0024AD8738|nr:nucleolar pre-ribosomal-associated protein 1 [Sorex fumeus]